MIIQEINNKQSNVSIRYRFFSLNPLDDDPESKVVRISDNFILQTGNNGSNLEDEFEVIINESPKIVLSVRS